MKIGDRIEDRYNIKSLIGRGGDLEPFGRRLTGKTGKLSL